MASKSVPSQDCDRGSALKEFGHCAENMRKVLYEDAELSDTEFFFIENHFRVLEMAYLRWKRKHQPHLSPAENGEVIHAKAA